MSKQEKFLIIVAALTILAILGYGLYKAYSNYKGDVGGNVSTDAAVYITENNLDEQLSIELLEMVPGDTKIYSFAVMNYDENNNLNETKMSYTISVDKSDNIPITLALYKNNVNTNIFDSNLIASNNLLGFDEQQTDTYNLVISWNASNNSVEYSDLTDYIDIIVHAEQVIGS